MIPGKTTRPTFAHAKAVAFTAAVTCGLGLTSSIGDVFTLWPRRGVAPRASEGGLTTALNALTVREEPVVVNGVRSVLSVKITRSDFMSCVKRLHSLYPNARLAFNGNGLLMESRLPDGDRQRVYLVAMGTAPFPVIQFSMRLPAAIPDSFAWSDTVLPALPHAVLKTHMLFPDSDATYGFFTTMASPTRSFLEIQTKLNTDGWRSVTAGAMPPHGQRGGVFIRDDPLSACVVQMDETSSGVVQGAVYTRPLRK